MYSMPKDGVLAQHIEIRKEQIGNGFSISGAIIISPEGELNFRFDEVQPAIGEYDPFKEAMTNFLEKLGLLDKITAQKIKEENDKKDVFFSK